MIEPHVHLAVPPRGEGLVYAVLWFARGNDVLGWVCGAASAQAPGALLSRWFWLEDYYTPDGSRSSFSSTADLRGDWVAPRLGHAPAPALAPEEDLLHALAMAQERVLRHWLQSPDSAVDPRSHSGAAPSPAGEAPGLGLRPDRLNKLQQGPVWWTYDSPGADRNLLDHLSRRWPLPHRVNA